MGAESPDGQSDTEIEKERENGLVLEIYDQIRNLFNLKSEFIGKAGILRVAVRGKTLFSITKVLFFHFLFSMKLASLPLSIKWLKCLVFI